MFARLADLSLLVSPPPTNSKDQAEMDPADMEDVEEVEEEETVENSKSKGRFSPFRFQRSLQSLFSSHWGRIVNRIQISK